MNLRNNFKEHSREVFFYATLDPERALGLEDVLPNYTIICPYSSQLTERLKKDGVNVVVLEENMNAKSVDRIVKKGTYGILQTQFVKNYINDKVKELCPGSNPGHVGGPTPHIRPHILVLKNSELIEDLCIKNKWHLIAPKAKIAEKFENKISQFNLLKSVVEYPKSAISTVEELLTSDVNKIRSDFNKIIDIRGQVQAPQKFVLQFNKGHSGNSTFFIKSKNDIKRFFKLYPKREVKISEYIKGKTYTLNCLVLGSGDIVTGSISEQITGLKKATNNPHTTVGNDFGAARKLIKKNIKSIIDIAESVGHTLFKNGYRGLFGIDVIIQAGSGKVYFIELNTHQPASIPFETKIHRKINKMPLLAYLILGRLEAVSPPIILPISARQVIYRNKTAKTLLHSNIDKKYINKGLISRMKTIKPNEEIYREQSIK